jgi:hypothetical protein
LLRRSLPALALAGQLQLGRSSIDHAAQSRGALRIRRPFTAPGAGEPVLSPVSHVKCLVSRKLKSNQDRYGIKGRLATNPRHVAKLIGGRLPLLRSAVVALSGAHLRRGINNAAPLSLAMNQLERAGYSVRKSRAHQDRIIVTRGRLTWTFAVISECVARDRVTLEEQEDWPDFPDTAWERYWQDGDSAALADAYLAFVQSTFLPSLLYSLEPFRSTSERQTTADALESAVRSGDCNESATHGPVSSAHEGREACLTMLESPSPLRSGYGPWDGVEIPV